MDFSVLFKAVRGASRLSQALLSEKSGLAIPNLSAFENGRREPRFSTAEAVLNASGYQLIAVATTRSTVADLATVIADDLAAGDTQSAFRMVIQINDNLVGEKGANKLAVALTPPASVGDVYWDATIAGVVEYRLNQFKLPSPEWVFDAWRSAKTKSELAVASWRFEIEDQDVPSELLKRNVLVDRVEFESV